MPRASVVTNRGAFVRARQAAGFTQEELAHKTGIAINTIRRIEKGEKRCSVVHVRTVAQVLGLEYAAVILQPQAADQEPVSTAVDQIPWQQPATNVEGSAERRQVTVLTCELASSAAICAMLDQEQWQQLVEAFDACCARVVASWGGSLSALDRGATTAHFGYPRAYEDNAARAIRASLELVERIQNIDLQDYPQLQGGGLNARIGVASGETVVTEAKAHGTSADAVGGTKLIGSSVFGSVEFEAMELQSLAPEGNVLVSEKTQRLAGGLFEYKLAGRPSSRSQRPSSEHVADRQPYHVVGPTQLRSRFDALRRPTLSEFVGRANEVERIKQCWDLAASGNGQVVLIQGEAGIGKSRLLEHIVEDIRNPARRVWSHNCEPHRSTSALDPIASGLRALAQFSAADTTSRKLAKLVKLVESGNLPADEFVPPLAWLIDLPYAGRYPQQAADFQRLSSRGQRKRVFDALVETVVAFAAKGPVIFTVEDLHWADSSTFALVQSVANRAPKQRVLVLLTSRILVAAAGDSNAEVTGKQAVPAVGDLTMQDVLPDQLVRLKLDPLNPVDSARLARSVLSNDNVDDRLVERIVERTDGNPLYIEDVAQDVQERGGYALEQTDFLATDGELQVPQVLRDALTSRLDRLGAAKEYAQFASVIGREFSLSLLARLSEMESPKLRDGPIVALVEAGILYRLDGKAQSTFIFKHALVRDTAYNNLLKADRQKLHARVAAILEQQDEPPEVLAYHLERGHLGEAAFLNWLAAGQHAVARSAFQEAVTAFERAAANYLSVRPTEALRAKEVELHLHMGAAQAGLRGFSATETAEAYGRALAVSQQQNHEEGELVALAGLGGHHLTAGEFDHVFAISKRCEQLSSGDQNAPGSLISRRLSGGASFLTGRLLTARAELESAIELYDANPDIAARLRSEAAPDHKSLALCYLPPTLLLLGYPELALARAEQAILHSRSLNHLHSMGFSYNFKAALHSLRGDHFSPHPDQPDRSVVEVEATASRDFAIEQAFGNLLGMSRIILGECLASQGQIQAGFAELGQGLTDHGEIRARIYMPYGLSLYAKALMQNRQWQEALDSLARAEAVIGQTGETWFLAELLRTKGQLHAACGRHEEARAGYAKAWQVAEEQSARFWQLRIAASEVRLSREQGSDSVDTGRLETILTSFDEGGEQQDLREARQLLA